MAFASRPDYFRPITDFDGARRDPSPRVRLEEVRKKSQQFREWFSAGPRASYYKTYPLIRVPYPVKYGLGGIARVPLPFLHILNRLFIIQFKTTEGIKTLLASPSDIKANAETPFFKQLTNRFGPLRGILEPFMAPKLGEVEEALLEVGLTPEDIDFISYDHLHTQDVRRWLGSKGTKPFFPNARLLVLKQEWISTNALLPPQMMWYCPNGIQEIDEEKIILLEDSTLLGEGVAIVSTPGHTQGNHSFVVNTEKGIIVTSENGIGPDCYDPRSSRIPGLYEHARREGAEVILNSNTLEGSVDQYISMVQEKEMAGRHQDNPDFSNIFCSSEMVFYWGFPFVRPTFTQQDMELGQLVRGAAHA